MNEPTIRDIPNIQDQRILVRVDFDVPVDGDSIIDGSRIRAAVPTIQYLCEKGGRVILMSHRGRPGGQEENSLRMKPVAAMLSDMLGAAVQTVDDCIGPRVVRAIDELPSGGVLLLENLRFHSGEAEGDPEFVSALAGLGDLYVNEAFSFSHKPHASIIGLPNFLPSYIGLEMEEETRTIRNFVVQPERPFVLILGGTRAGEKVATVAKLLPSLDSACLGGLVGAAFLHAAGYDIGDTPVAKKCSDVARDIFVSLASKDKIAFAKDVIVGLAPASGGEFRTARPDEILPDEQIFDIGPKTIMNFTQLIEKAKTIVWTGPMGIFEIEELSKGTRAIAQAIAKSDAASLVGGGATGAIVRQLGLEENISHISIGGAAFLDFLLHDDLPGLEAIRESPYNTIGAGQPA